MSDQQLFTVVNTAPLLGWLALALAPVRRGPLIAFARFLSICLCVAYALMLGASLAAPGAPMPDFNHVDALAKGFSNPHVMLIGWAHYLAFDLWTGAWEAEEAHRRGVPHWALVPCLLLTLLAGPVGLLLFLILRSALGARKRLSPS